ncbi:isochorismatase family protein [Streptomyces sp. HD1123-B1]|uniref:isochorismatase family protein n=1 Tax=Streptomyces huangiella TaxID=3228804 RepID=UPI003D7E8E29
MAATMLEPDTALVLVDLQKGITALPTAHPAAEVVPGRTESGPSRPGPRPADFAELAPGLGRTDDDIVVTKHTWGAFHGTDLDLRLRRRGVTQVVLGGIATSIGVESTARAAYEHGYHVTVATDAVTDMDPEAHRNSVERIFPRLGETGTADELIALLG